MLCKILLSAGFSEQLHYSFLAQGFTFVLSSAGPVVLTATSLRLWLELSLGGGDAFACLLQPSKWRCRNEFWCWAPTDVRKSGKFRKICNFACCYQHLDREYVQRWTEHQISSRNDIATEWGISQKLSSTWSQGVQRTSDQSHTSSMPWQVIQGMWSDMLS